MSVDYIKYKLPLASTHNNPITPLLCDPRFILSTAKQFITISNYWNPSAELNLAKKHILLVKGIISNFDWFRHILEKEIPRLILSTYTYLTTSTPEPSQSPNPKNRNYVEELKEGAKITANSIKSCDRLLSLLKNLKKSEILDLGVTFSFSKTILSTADLASKLFIMEKTIQKLSNAESEVEKNRAIINVIIALSKTIFSFIRFVATLYMTKLSLEITLLSEAIFFLASTIQKIQKNAFQLQKKTS